MKKIRLDGEPVDPASTSSFEVSCQTVDRRAQSMDE